MTIQEAIYCMKAYLPDHDNVSLCIKCPYYGSVDNGNNVFTCKSDEAHHLAIEALQAYLNNSAT